MSGTGAEKVAEVRALLGGACGFAELLATLHTLRFTGAVEVQFLNGQPQAAALGQPVVLRFSEHPANRNLTGSSG